MTDLLAPYRARVDQQLDIHLNRQDVPARLLEAMRYSVFIGGKRIRPALVYLATEATGGELVKADRTACAVEMIHAYSLIHDDLPSMDDDALRRGQPTSHIKFDEATAILAGDALQALAFETLATDTAIEAGTRAALVARLAHAAGPGGMVGGQMTDLLSEDRTISESELEQMHHCKTGALISASVVAGATITGAEADVTGALERFGFALGLAFQVQDDILDVTGETHVIGKQVGADEARRKTTFVSLHGMDAAREHLERLHAEALEALQILGPGGEKLRKLADFVINRDH